MRNRIDTRTLLASRRNFLLGAVGTGVAAGMGLPSLARAASGSGYYMGNEPVLANIMLNGGPDHRHLLMPKFRTAAGTFGHEFWRTRARSQNTAMSNSALQARYDDDYLPCQDPASGVEFGMLAEASWLKSMWDAGKVAIISNVAGDDSRDHENAIRSMELGNRFAEKLTRGSGWGGRAAVAAGGKTVALTPSIRTFCLGPDPAAPNNPLRSSDLNVVPATDMRNLQPYIPEPGEWVGFGNAVARSLNAYYRAKRSEMDPGSPAFRFMEHERKLREFGAVVDERLANVERPAAIAELAMYDAAETTGIRPDLAFQIANLYDALACQDILDMAIASMEFNGWDTHDSQRDEIEFMLRSLYAPNGALDRLYTHLPGGPDGTVADRLVLLLYGEFGRQINDNGGNGTDHGYGGYVLVIGNQVNGGVYGDMFPEEELALMGEEGADTLGQTAIDHVFGRLCDWVSPNIARTVFPGIDDAMMEPGIGLDSLIT